MFGKALEDSNQIPEVNRIRGRRFATIAGADGGHVVQAASECRGSVGYVKQRNLTIRVMDLIRLPARNRLREGRDGRVVPRPAPFPEDVFQAIEIPLMQMMSGMGKRIRLPVSPLPRTGKSTCPCHPIRHVAGILVAVFLPQAGAEAEH